MLFKSRKHFRKCWLPVSLSFSPKTYSESFSPKLSKPGLCGKGLIAFVSFSTSFNPLPQNATFWCTKDK